MVEIKCKGCKKCVTCPNFHKIESINTENNVSIIDIPECEKPRDGDNFCFVITCKAKLPEEKTKYVIRIGNESYKLIGKVNKFKKRKLYKAKVSKNNIILLY